MSLHFGNNDEAQDDAAQIEIAGLMDMRRRALREQMIADEVRNDLCNAVIEWRTKLGVSQATIVALRDCNDADVDVRNAHHALYEYIRRLETFQSVFWCQKCNTMKSVGDKPEGFVESANSAPVVQTPVCNEPVAQTPNSPASDNILDAEIPEYLSMDEIVIILRGLQQEVRKLRNRHQNTVDARNAMIARKAKILGLGVNNTVEYDANVPERTTVAEFVEKYDYMSEGFPADEITNFYDGYTDTYDHCNDDCLTADDF